ncbi:MAG TPA: DNA polymerase III subunit delta [Solirubrobacteraceae bacterium]
MPTFKAAYLIHGDDHGRISERRARLRALAESLSGAEGLEIFEGEQSTPETVARALDAMTLVMGRRFIIVDGTEGWKEKDLEPLAAAVGAIAPETTITFFAREEGTRLKAPSGLHAMVRKAGGQIDAENSVKAKELPRWVEARARELGLELEPDAARALIRHVGDRQQRLQRELEKLALGTEPGARLDADEIDELTASSAERRAWVVADALVAGDAKAATRTYLALRAQGERLPGLIYWLSQRVRIAHGAAAALERGEAPAQVKRGMRMPGWAADQLIADARRAGADHLRDAVGEIADLELASRGGLSRGGSSEDTAALLAIEHIAG